MPEPDYETALDYNSVLIGADLHLQVGALALDTTFALNQIAELAVKHRVAAVLLGGDIFDSPRNLPEPVNAFHCFLNALSAAGSCCAYILGNHDYSAVGWLEGHPALIRLPQQAIRLGNVNVYGIDFQVSGRLQEALAKVPDDVDLLLLHQCWGDWCGSVTNPQGSFCEIPKVSFVCTGDLHRCKVEKHIGRDGQEMLVASPGATVAQAINEPHENFVMLFDKSKKRFQIIQLKSRPFISIGPLIRPEDVTELLDGKLEAQIDEAVQWAHADKLPAELRRPHIRLVYDHILSDVVRRVSRLVGDKAKIFFKEIAPDRGTSLRRAEAVERDKGGAVTPLTLLPDVIDQEQDPEAYALASLLLNQPNDQTGAFNKWRAAYMAAQQEAPAEEAVA